MKLWQSLNFLSFFDWLTLMFTDDLYIIMNVYDSIKYTIEENKYYSASVCLGGNIQSAILRNLNDTQ